MMNKIVRTLVRIICVFFVDIVQNNAQHNFYAKVLIQLRWINYLLLLFALIIASCSMGPIAGGGSDLPDMKIVSGVIYTETGNPSSNTQVIIMPQRYNVLIEGPVPDSLADTTDQAGRYYIALKDTGSYNIQAVHTTKRTRAFVAGITVTEDTTFTPAGILKDAGIIKLFLPDTIDTINGYVYIEGSTIYKKLSASITDSSGLFITLDSVPEATISSIYYARTGNPAAPAPITDTLTITSNDTTVEEAFVYWANYTKDNTGLPGNMINDMDASPTTVVFATSGGIAELTPTGYWIVYTGADIGLQTNIMTSVSYLYNGRLWVGTSAGAAALKILEWKTYTTGNSNIPTNRITDIEIEPITTNNVWLGTEDKGLLKFNDTVWTVYDTGNSGIPSNAVTTVFVDRGDTVWCTTHNGVFKLKGSYSKVLTSSNSGLPSDDIYCMAIDKNRHKWFGYNGGVARYNEADDIWTEYTSLHSAVFADSVLSIAEGSDGTMWFGTPKGLCMFDGITWFDYSGSKYQKLANCAVRTIAIDNNLNKWIGTANKGVITFGPTKK